MMQKTHTGLQARSPGCSSSAAHLLLHQLWPGGHSALQGEGFLHLLFPHFHVMGIKRPRAEQKGKLRLEEAAGSLIW